MRPAAFRCAKPCAGCSRHPETACATPVHSGLGTRDSGLGTRDSGLGTRDSGRACCDFLGAAHPGRRPLFLTSSRTARSAEPASHPGRRAAPSRPVIPDGAQRRAGTQRPCDESDWIPASAGMTAKKRDHPRRRAPSFDVIPDGAQRRAGIQTGAPQVPLNPRFTLRVPGDDTQKAKHPHSPRFTAIPAGALQFRASGSSIRTSRPPPSRLPALMPPPARAMALRAMARPKPPPLPVCWRASALR